MIKFSNKLKKIWFCPILALFPNVGTKKIFSQKIWLSRTASYEFLAQCQISEKTNDTILKKCLDRRTDRPYFIGPFWLPSGVLKMTDMKTYGWAQKQRKKFKKTISLLPMPVTSVLSTKCGGYHPKGLIVASSHKIKQIIILKFIYGKANSPFC